MSTQRIKAEEIADVESKGSGDAKNEANVVAHGEAKTEVKADMKTDEKI